MAGAPPKTGTEPPATTRYLRGASPAFQEAFARMGETVRRVFPKAQAVFAYGMPGWRVPGSKPVPEEAKGGTIDPAYLWLFLVERKAGVTLHLWNPADLAGLERDRTDLEAAGFKVMRGCLQFNRKRPYPFEAVARLLERARATI